MAFEFGGHHFLGFSLSLRGYPRLGRPFFGVIADVVILPDSLSACSGWKKWYCFLMIRKVHLLVGMVGLAGLLAAGCQSVKTPVTTMQLQKSYKEELGTVLAIKEIVYNDSPDDRSGVVGGVIAGALIGSDDGAAFEGALVGGLLGGIGDKLSNKTAYEIRIGKDGGEAVTVLQRTRGLRGLQAQDRVRILTDPAGGTVIEKVKSR